MTPKTLLLSLPRFSKRRITAALTAVD